MNHVCEPFSIDLSWLHLPACSVPNVFLLEVEFYLVWALLEGPGIGSAVGSGIGNTVSPGSRTGVPGDTGLMAWGSIEGLMRGCPWGKEDGLELKSSLS